MSETVPAALWDAAAAMPEAHAAFTSEGTVDYATFARSVERTIGGLHDAGVGTGSRVGVLMGNSFPHLTLAYAVPASGGVLVDIDPAWTPAEVESIVRDAELVALAVDDPHLGSAEELLRRGVRVRILDPGDLAAGSPASGTPTPELIAAISYEAVGRPARRGRAVTHRDLVAAARYASTRLRIDHTDRYLHVVPMATTADVILGLACTAQGAGHAFAPAMTPAAVREGAERDRITLAVVGPGMVGALRRDPQTYGADLTSLRAVVAMEAEGDPGPWPGLPDLGFAVHPLAETTGGGMAEVDLTTTDPSLTTTSGSPD